MAKVFRKKLRIPFSEVDTAEVLFFANYFKIAHDVYEDFLEELGYDWKAWFKNGKWLAYLRHVEADYLKPVLGGHRYEIEMVVGKLGTSSYEMKYRFLQMGEAVAEVRHVHAFTSMETQKKMDIPAEIRQKLTDYLAT